MDIPAVRSRSLTPHLFPQITLPPPVTAQARTAPLLSAEIAHVLAQDPVVHAALLEGLKALPLKKMAGGAVDLSAVPMKRAVEAHPLPNEDLPDKPVTEISSATNSKYSPFFKMMVAVAKVVTQIALLVTAIILEVR